MKRFKVTYIFGKVVYSDKRRTQYYFRNSKGIRIIISYDRYSKALYNSISKTSFLDIFKNKHQTVSERLLTFKKK